MRLLVALAALGLAQAALAEDGELSAWAGINYSRGSYGGPGTTQVLSIPFAGRSEGGSGILRGTLPYLPITGTGIVVVPGVGPVSSASSSGGGILGLPILGG